jgi:hypothetical protein
MAYLVRRSSDRVEIRESRATRQGPRSVMLASFTGPLTPQVLHTAAARAARPFDARECARRARAAGIPVAEQSHEPEARCLLARLRRPEPLDPVLVSALRQALDRQSAAPAPEALAEVTEWLGASLAERGAALRELLDMYGRIAESRALPRRREAARFPRFSSLDRTG